MSEESTETNALDEAYAELKKRSRRKKAIIISAIVVVLIIAAVVFFLFWRGALAPAGAAAKYDTLSYISEQDVTDYIETYKSNMGYGEASDEEWASYLDSCSLTPETLRSVTIKQLVVDQEAIKRAKSLRIDVSDDEVQASVDALKESIAFNDDDTWASTLELYGTTEDDVFYTYYLQMVKDRLCEQEVPMPTPTDDEVLEYTKNYCTVLTSDETTTKHTYCFKISQDTDGTLTNSTIANEVHDALSEPGALDVESFATAVSMYSDDDDLVAKTGANGWDADSTGYSETYLSYIEQTEVGEMSEIFNDEDGTYCFIYVDTSYTFPSDTEAIEALTLDEIPDSLLEYLRDSCAYAAWTDDCTTYIQSLVDDANLIIFGMPSGLPYDVDMSLVSTDSSSSKSSEDSE